MRTAWLVWLLPSIAFAQAVPSPDGARAPTSDETLENHTPGKGTELASGAWGEVTFSVYLSVRYLNQRGLDSTTTDARTGMTRPLDLRDDVQFQKTILYFKGWLGVPALQYLTYVWTSNASQGLGAQVVVAGNLSYKVSDALNIAAGIDSLPTTRTTRGTFPAWLKQDSRTVADEYFRGSYTSGVRAKGSFGSALHYKAMIGNNLSQLGVDAGQLDAGMNTYSAAAWWTTDNFGANEGYGDVNRREEIAASIGAAYTYSREDREAQPGTEAPENSQVRISNGLRIFDDGAIAPGVAIERVTYQMASINGAIKLHGFALEGELYKRWLGSFTANGPLPVDHLDDHGFQLQGSAMVSSQVMLYAYGSKVFGDYGDPWDLGIGANYFPFENRVLRVNAEAILADESPVGNLSSPLLVGADGFVFVANVELFF